MRPPAPNLQGIIERRILVNYRVDPGVLARLLPPPFRPKLVRGFGVGGICLIRLGAMRPALFPRVLGFSSENVAHRVAVTWGARPHEGVYVLRRDTASTWNALAGGRLYPGIHGRATFDVRAQGGDLSISVRSRDGALRIDVAGRAGGALRSGLFASMDEARAFYRGGALGFSPARGGGFEALELACAMDGLEPFELHRASSSLFEEASSFPPGSVALDGAFLMRDVPHRWMARPPLAAMPASIREPEPEAAAAP